MIGELIEKLCIANIKLFNICDKKVHIAANPGSYSKNEITKVMAADIELCKQRANLKKAIDSAINSAIISGEASVIDEVKNYGG